MKHPIKILSFALIASIFFACGGKNQNSEVEKREQQNPKKVEEQTDSKSNKASSEIIKIKAKFRVMNASSSGTWHVFIDEAGKEYNFFGCENNSLGENIDMGKLEPSNPEHPYQNIWFDIEYIEKTMDFYQGEKISKVVLRIVSMKKSGASESTSGLSANDLKNVVFFGNEPLWSLKLYEDYAEYIPMGQSSIKLYYTKTYMDNSKSKLSQAIKIISDKEVEIQAQEGDGGALFTIKKESCSDGESNNKYPYKILMANVLGKVNGCGRIIK